MTLDVIMTDSWSAPAERSCQFGSSKPRAMPMAYEPQDVLDRYEKILDRFDDARAAKNYDLAHRMIERAIQLRPNYFYSFYKKAFLFKSMKTKSVETLKCCKHALFLVQVQGNQFWTCVLNGFLEELNNDLQGAYKYYKQAIDMVDDGYHVDLERYEHVADVYFRMGMILGDQKNFTHAIEHFERAYELEHKPYYLGMCYNNIGWCYKQMNDDYSACDNYSRAIAENDRVVLFFTNRVKSYKSLQKYDEAMKDIEVVLGGLTRDKRTMSEMMCELGLIFHAKKQFERAREQFTTALKVYDRMFFPYLFLASLSYMDSRLEDSLRLLDEGIDKCYDDETGLNYLIELRARIHRLLGNNDLANNDTNRLLSFKKKSLSRID
jgi:tetratricopeptide (TPR) repeat protein